MTLDTFFAYALLSLTLGSLIGLERQWHRRLVDLKTNALVCFGACLFMMTSASAAGYVEPIRMAAQIVVGVGFIGGGLLFRDGTQTRGINTAATLWCSAAIGTLCGLGRWAEATSAAVLLVAANTVLRDVARRLQMRMGLGDALTEQLMLELVCARGDTARVREALETALTTRRGELRSVSETLRADGHSLICATAAFESVDPRVEVDAVLRAAESWPLISISWRRL